MDVVITVAGNIKVNDRLKLVRGDVEPTSRHACSYKHQASLGSEVLQYRRTLILRTLPVEETHVPSLESLS